MLPIQKTKTQKWNVKVFEISRNSSNMATAASDFEPWLTEKLRSLKTDEGVFGSYISGILETEDSVDEKKDALEGILSEIVVSINIVNWFWEMSGLACLFSNYCYFLTGKGHFYSHR